MPLTNDEALLSGQLIGALTIFGWVFLTSGAVWYLLKLSIGIRVSAEEEYQGMDMVDCGMEAYPEFTRQG